MLVFKREIGIENSFYFSKIGFKPFFYISSILLIITPKK